MKTIVTALLSTITGCVLAACGGEPTTTPVDTPDSAFNCTLEEETGSWTVYFDQRDGNCGNLPSQLLNLGADPVPFEPTVCIGTSSVSGDQCRMQGNASCAIDGFQIHQRYAVRQLNPDLVTGVLSVTMAGWCSGSYDIRAERL